MICGRDPSRMQSVQGGEACLGDEFLWKLVRAVHVVAAGDDAGQVVAGDVRLHLRGGQRARCYTRTAVGATCPERRRDAWAAAVLRMKDGRTGSLSQPVRWLFRGRQSCPRVPTAKLFGIEMLAAAGGASAGRVESHHHLRAGLGRAVGVGRLEGAVLVEPHLRPHAGLTVNLHIHDTRHSIRSCLHDSHHCSAQNRKGRSAWVMCNAVYGSCCDGG